jgi:hypothetical protein
MYTGSDFSPASPGEDEPYGFEFAKSLVEGETIASAEFSLSRSGCGCGWTDVTGKLTGSVNITGTRVTQHVTDLPVGRYRLSCIVQTNIGRHKLHSYIVSF